MTKKEVQTVIDKIRPSLQMDGGDIKLVSVTAKGIIKVKLQGACHHCPMAAITLKQGVEAYLKKSLKGVKGVVAVEY